MLEERFLESVSFVGSSPQLPRGELLLVNDYAEVISALLRDFPAASANLDPEAPSAQAATDLPQQLKQLR